MRHLCAACAKDVVPPRGYIESPLLIIGEFPGEHEMESGKPFSGPAGGVLRSELARVGIDMPMVRVMNLWQHPKNDDKRCYKEGLNLVLEEAKGREAIFMVGSEVVNAFTRYSVSAICGLQLSKTDHKFSAPVVMCSPNPAIVFHKGIGEVRFSVEKLDEALREHDIMSKLVIEDIDE